MFWRHGVPETGGLQAWAAANWNEIVEPGDAAHLAHGVTVIPIRNREGAHLRRLMRYLGKYMAKGTGRIVSTATGEVLPIGRVWGVWGELPQEVVAQVVAGWEQWVKLTRRIRRWGKGSRYLRHLTANRNGWRVLYDGYLLVDLVATL